MQTPAENIISYATVNKGAAEFKRGRDSKGDEPRSGHLKTSCANEQVDASNHMVLIDRH